MPVRDSGPQGSAELMVLRLETIQLLLAACANGH